LEGKGVLVGMGVSVDAFIVGTAEGIEGETGAQALNKTVRRTNVEKI
jgi:hypothetical protein